MIHTETRTHRHELLVALAKARLFRCFKTHLDSNWYQKKKSIEEEEEHKNKVYTKRKLQIRFYNNKKKEENFTPVSLSAQASFSFSYETLISSDLHKLKLKIT